MGNVKSKYPCFSHILGDIFFNQITIICKLKNEIYIPLCSRYFSFGHHLWETKFKNSYTVLPLRKIFALNSQSMQKENNENPILF